MYGAYQSGLSESTVGIPVDAETWLSPGFASYTYIHMNLGTCGSLLTLLIFRRILTCNDILTLWKLIDCITFVCVVFLVGRFLILEFPNGSGWVLGGGEKDGRREDWGGERDDCFRGGNKVMKYKKKDGDGKMFSDRWLYM